VLLWAVRHTLDVRRLAADHARVVLAAGVLGAVAWALRDAVPVLIAAGVAGAGWAAVLGMGGHGARLRGGAQPERGALRGDVPPPQPPHGR
jgi:hypothetical protein